MSSLLKETQFTIEEQGSHASAYPKSAYNFEGLNVSKKAFSFLQPLLHEWMSEWMKSWLEVVMIKAKDQGGSQKRANPITINSL